MDAVFQRSEECFEPFEAFTCGGAEFLVMGDGPVDFDDPGEVLSFGGPGFHHIGVGKTIKTHVQFDGV